MSSIVWFHCFKFHCVQVIMCWKYCKPIKVCDPLSLRNSRVSFYRKNKWTQIQEVANIIYQRRTYECRIFVTSGYVVRLNFQYYAYISGTMHFTEIVHLSYESSYHHEYDYYKHNTLLIKMVKYFSEKNIYTYIFVIVCDLRLYFWLHYIIYM